MPVEIQSEAPEEDEQRFHHETQPTVCACCYYAPSDARYRPWWDWLCMHDTAKLPATFNPVTGQTVADPPRIKCRSKNMGNCPHWKEARNIFGLKIAVKERDNAH